MGFDQYHEPPEELPAATRTFARLCASLTEEAEAIGWYEQRLAVETDPEALAIMRDAQGEEFKHFSMDLEFLLRRTPAWREIAQGILFQAGDIVEHGEEAEAEAFEGDGAGSRRRVRGRLARDRQPEGSVAMNHLLRAHAPISDAGWKLLDEEARERLTPALAARKLVDFSGPHGWEHSATNLGRTTPLGSAAGRGRLGSAAACPAARRAARRLRALARGAARRRSRRRRHRPRGARQGRPPDRDRRERGRLPRLARRDHGHRGGLAPRADPARRDGGRLPAPSRERRRAAAVQRHRRRRTVSRSGASSTAAWSRPPSTAAIRCSSTCARSSKDRSSGRPAWTARWSLSLRGGDFVFESGQDLSIGYDSHDADVVRLYLEESFSFHVATPEAAVTLKP